MKIEIDQETLRKIDRLRTWSGNILKNLKLTPGQDAYEYHGSMNDVEALKEAHHDYEMCDFCEQTVAASESEFDWTGDEWTGDEE